MSYSDYHNTTGKDRLLAAATGKEAIDRAGALRDRLGLPVTHRDRQVAENIVRSFAGADPQIMADLVKLPCQVAEIADKLCYALGQRVAIAMRQDVVDAIQAVARERGLSPKALATIPLSGSQALLAELHAREAERLELLNRHMIPDYQPLAEA